MSSGHSKIQGGAGSPGAVRPLDEHLLSLGKLTYLAAYCDLHRRISSQGLATLFIPAVNNGCVRFFEDENGATAAALIWARLSDKVSERMLFEKVPPTGDEWTAGNNLWFLDLIAPFGHGPMVARYLARNAPEGPFFFARSDETGRVRKVVEGDKTRGRRGFVHAFQIGRAGG